MTGPKQEVFCYIDGLVDGIIKMMDSREDFVGPVTLGNPTEFTILGLAKKIIKLTNSKSKIIYKPLPEDDPRRRKPGIILTKEKLGWQPIIDLEDGLAKTIEYFDVFLAKRIK